MTLTKFAGLIEKGCLDFRLGLCVDISVDRIATIVSFNIFVSILYYFSPL